jgi:hypothetical protein
MLFDRSDPSAASTRQATFIGATAKALVSVPGFSGRMLAILPDVAYLSGKDGEILWLFREGVPLHGRGILFSFPRQCLHSGQSILMEGHSLKIGREVAIGLGRAAEWRPDPLRQEEIAPLARVRERVRQLLGTIAPNRGDIGHSQPVSGLCSLMKGEDESVSSPDALQPRILSTVFGLMTHCIENGLRGIETRGLDLIGLGPGLTPCGDDFLGGLFFAAHWLQRAYGEERYPEMQPILDLVQWARTRTHPISHAIMGDLVVGQGPEPLHRLLRLLLKGEALDGRTNDAVECLLKIGHTTGRYMLAGLLTCLLAVDEQRCDDRASLFLPTRVEPFYPQRAIFH